MNEKTLPFENHMCYYSDDTIKIEDFDINILIHENHTKVFYLITFHTLILLILSFYTLDSIK